MSYRRWLLFFFFSSLTLATPRAVAQAGAAIEAAAQELVEAIGRQFGEQGVKELGELGGEAGVRDILQKATQEGGEELANRVAYYGRNYGVSALKGIAKDPRTFVPALDQLESGLVKPALYAIEREPETMQKLLINYGQPALKLAAKHPGVETMISENLGKEGIETALKLSTDDAIRLGRYSDDLAMVPSSERGKILDKIGEMPGRVFDYLEQHPKVLLTTGGIATVLSLKKELIGNSDGPGRPKPGLIERIVYQAINIFRKPLSLILGVIALSIFGWAGIQIWSAYRLARLRHHAALHKPRNSLETDLP